MGNAAKAKIFERLIQLHEAERDSLAEMIKRLEKSPSFTEAVVEAREKKLRIEKILTEYQRQIPLFAKTSQEIEIGALVTVDSTQFGPRRQLLVHATEITYFDTKDYELAAVNLDNFQFKSLGEKQSYFTGRPGEQFEVIETLIKIE